jgi:uncharacterized iron-regulated protein
MGQKNSSHVIFNKNMKKSSFKKIIKATNDADVIFFGEMHDDPICHWLELKLLKQLKVKGDVVLGLEMFERDNQVGLDDYLNGTIDYEGLATETRLWNNYKTDYAPMVDFAKENKIKCIATNVPRRYASMVYKDGFEVLEELVQEEKMHIAELPISYDPNLPSYQKMLTMMEGHGGENFPKAQAIKDATMAYSISKTFEKGKKYLHINGSFHSDNFEGIIWYLNKYSPDLKVVTITSLLEGDESDNVTELKGKADFIVKVDADMGRTY